MQTLDLAVIGNGVIAALVDSRASIVWGCFPRLDGDPIFCRLLNGDREDGFCDIVLENITNTSQRYLGNTAVLETVMTDAAGGSIRVTDFVPRFKRFDRIFRPAQIVRRIEPLGGLPSIRIRIRPRFANGSEAGARTLGSNSVRYAAPGGGAMRVTTDAALAYLDRESPFVLTRPITMVIGGDELFAGPLTQLTSEFLEQTQDYWVEWSRYLAIPFEWQAVVIRAAITLKLCSFEETGAIVAALTTSVPEAANTPRNWDYRYCWLRDSYFTVHALNRLGATRTMESYLDYITNVMAQDPDGDLKPLYGIVPGEPLEERIVESLPGYRGMGPVRVGNLAVVQRQNDVYGSVILAVAQMFFDRRLPKAGDVALFQRLEVLGARAAEGAFIPDAGIWEFRGRERVHTHSAALCWAACDRLAKIAHVLGLAARTAHWRKTAKHIREEILKRAWNEELGSFVESFDGKDLDASLLLLQELGLVAADDPRFIGTVDAIGKGLKRGNYLLRYAAADDFGLPETSFTVCTFWYIEALAAIGRRDEAREMFEFILARRNPLGILSEDMDHETGELWGNFPQTYSMVGVIVCAMRLSKSWEEAFWRGS